MTAPTPVAPQPTPNSQDSQGRQPPLDVLIVGAGFAGLTMLIEARRAGLSARVLEAAGGVGGTWYHNRYPGARVDIQSMEYSFGFDEALQQDWHWTERYASQPELLRYANHIADRFALRDGIQFNTRVAAAAWDEAGQCWQVHTERGQAWTARFVVMAAGPLSTPNTPDLPGLADFKGPVLHTGRWPHQPVDFSGQRVGVIGTGSSGVQAIPVIAGQAAQLTVFQRTATYAVPAHNGPLDADHEARIKADYAGFRQRNLQTRGGFGCETPPNPGYAVNATPAEREAAFEHRWSIGGFAFLGAFDDLLLDPVANEMAAEFVRGKIRSTVHDPATARLLCPSHTIGCKRLCVDSTGYYATFNRPNVQLVDLNAEPIAHFTATGLQAGGRHHALDSLVLATGFDAMTGTLLRLDLRGRGGQTIQHKWAAGPLNHLGLMVNGFPNFFNVVGPGSTSAFTNMTVAIEQHIAWITNCITWLRRQGRHTIEPTADAEAEWIAHVNKLAQRTLYLSCASWYLGANIPGKPRVFMPAIGFPQYAARCAAVAREGYPGFVTG